MLIDLKFNINFVIYCVILGRISNFSVPTWAWTQIIKYYEAPSWWSYKTVFRDCYFFFLKNVLLYVCIRCVDTGECHIAQAVTGQLLALVFSFDIDGVHGFTEKSNRFVWDIASSNRLASDSLPPKAGFLCPRIHSEDWGGLKLPDITLPLPSPSPPYWG